MAVDNKEFLLSKVCGLKVWKSNGLYAPHKPLLVILAVKWCRRGSERLNSFIDIEKSLTPLLRTLLPKESKVEPRYPFWRLQTDKIWEVQSDGGMLLRQGNTDPLRSELISKNARGGFPQDFFNLLSSDEKFRARLIRLVLERYFIDDEQNKICELLSLVLNQRN